MIGRLQGALVHRDGTEGIIDVAGVGYLVNAPNGALDAWGDHPKDVQVHVSTQVREDAITLYGFATWQDRVLFTSLLGVSGVGPRTALACIDTLSPASLCRAIQEDDVRTLSMVPGVGKKTAQRMAIDLKDKLPGFAIPGDSSAGPAASTIKSDDNFAAALQRLGYSRAEVSYAKQQLDSLGLDSDATLSERLRAALRVLYER